MKICFAGTTAFGGTIYPDDGLMADLLVKKGYFVDYIPWDKPGETWDRHDIYINRCTWRYQEKYAEFESWLKHLAATGRPCFNSPALQLWSTNKQYLQEFESKGISIVPSLFSSNSDLSDIRDELEMRGWVDVVCKPSIGAGGFDVVKLQNHDLNAEEEFFEKILHFHPLQKLIIQPFINSVVTRGEWSFVFFDGHFSHALLKTPANGEFRIQSRLGGSTRKVTPETWQIEAAAQCLKAIDETPLYARIDGFFVGDRFLLGEFEVCEPYLWLSEQADSAEVFANALIERLS